MKVFAIIAALSAITLPVSGSPFPSDVSNSTDYNSTILDERENEPAKSCRVNTQIINRWTKFPNSLWNIQFSDTRWPTADNEENRKNMEGYCDHIPDDGACACVSSIQFCGYNPDADRFELQRLSILDPAGKGCIECLVNKFRARMMAASGCDTG